MYGRRDKRNFIHSIARYHSYNINDIVSREISRARAREKRFNKFCGSEWKSFHSIRVNTRGIGRIEREWILISWRRATINLKSFDGEHRFRRWYYSFRVSPLFLVAPVDELASKVRRLVSRRSKSKFDRKWTMALPNGGALYYSTSYGETQLVEFLLFLRQRDKLIFVSFSRGRFPYFFSLYDWTARIIIYSENRASSTGNLLIHVFDKKIQPDHYY